MAPELIEVRHHVEGPRPEDRRDDHDQRDVVHSLRGNPAPLGARTREHDPEQERQREEEPVRVDLEDAEIQQSRVHQSLRRSPTPTTIPRAASVERREVPP
jgi:hypothetical protein